MQQPVPRATWLLLACTLALSSCGYLLWGGETVPPHAKAEGPQPGSRAQRTPGAHPTPHALTSTENARPLAPNSTPPRAHTPIPPPPGDGRAADRQIQNLIEEAWPADLPVTQERQLRQDGALLLRADATGEGRERFPQVFGDRPTQQVAPAFSRLRIQAAIARKDQQTGRAVVHLVWAAVDRGGTYADGRVSDLTFHRPKGHGPWTALPRP
ncbi:hypothetical protein [Streptomyces sp. NPDC055099]